MQVWLRPSADKDEWPPRDICPVACSRRCSPRKLGLDSRRWSVAFSETPVARHIQLKIENAVRQRRESSDSDDDGG